MENCAKCGKELLWNEKKLVFWNMQLRRGYIRWMVMGSPLFGKQKDFPSTPAKSCAKTAP